MLDILIHKGNLACSEVEKMRKQTVLALCSILLLCLRVYATVLSSRVIDTDGRGIAQVSVADGRRVTFTDSDGYFSIESVADSLSISRLGYIGRKISLFEANQIIILETKPLSLPTVRVYERYDRGSAAALDALSIHPDTNYGRRSAGDILLDHYIMESSATPLSGEVQNVSILGNLSRHTLVLLDGVPVNKNGEPFDFSRIPASQISHIEVIKGASSVYGGSSAIGGVVNIVTIKPKTDKRFEFESGGGSLGLFSIRCLASESAKHHNISAQYSHSSANNNFSYKSSQGSGERENNAKRQDQFFIKGALVHNIHQLELMLSLNDFYRQLPGTVNNLPLFDNAFMEGRDYIYRLAMASNKENWTNEIGIFGDGSVSTYKNLDSSVPFYSAHNKTKTNNITLKDIINLKLNTLSFELAAEQSFMGYNYSNYLNNQPSNNSDSSRLLTGLSAFVRHNKDWDLISWEQGYALRQDWLYGENISDNFSPWRIEQSISFHLPLQTRLYGSLGTAYSIPTFADMYWMGDSNVQGNPLLKSEKSQGGLIGFNASQQYVQLKLEYSHNRIRNLIRWHKSDGYTWKPYNVGKAEINNLEFGLSLYPLNNFSLEGGIVFTDAKDRSENSSAIFGKYLIYTPDTKANIALKLKKESWGLNLSFRYTGDQYSTPDNLIGTIDGFNTLHLNTWTKFRALNIPLTIDLKLDNILNNKYEIYAHTPQPGFNWSAGIKLEL